MIKQIVYKIIVQNKGWKLLYNLSMVIVILSIFYCFFLNYFDEPIYNEDNVVNLQMNMQGSGIVKSMKKIMINMNQQIKGNYSNEKLVYVQKFFEKYKMENQILNFKDLQKKWWFESKIQNKKEGNNLIGIFHPKRTPNFECDVISYYVSDDANFYDIAFILALIQHLNSEKINYISRSILFLGLDKNFKQNGYATSQFLKNYFDEYEISMPRCGIIRNSIHIDFQDEQINSIQYSYTNLNGRYPLIDYYTLIASYLQKFHISFVHSKSNLIQTRTENFLENNVQYILQNIFGIKYPHRIFDFSYFLSSLKLTIFGDYNDPHPQFSKYSVHAVTLKGYDNKKSKDQLTLEKFSQCMENIIRSLQSLDYSLHHGNFYYFPTKNNRFIPLGQLVIPGALCGSFLFIVQLVRFFQLDLQLSQKKPIIQFFKNLFIGTVFLALPHALQKMYEMFDIQFANNEFLVFFLILLLISLILNCFIARNFKEHQYQTLIHDQNLKFYNILVSIFITQNIVYWTLNNLAYSIFTMLILVPLQFIVNLVSTFQRNIRIFMVLPLLLSVSLQIGYEYINFQKYFTLVLQNYLNHNGNLFWYICLCIIPYILSLIEIIMY